jgi:hypothetical protein
MIEKAIWGILIFGVLFAVLPMLYIIIDDWRKGI